MRTLITILTISFSVAALTAVGQSEELDYDTVCGSSVVDSPDTYVTYAFGRKALVDRLNDYSLIPISNKETEFPVRVKLLVCPDYKFTIAKIVVEDSYYKALHVETERIVKLVRGFTPATKNGENVASYYWFQINYKPKKNVPKPDRIITNEELEKQNQVKREDRPKPEITYLKPYTSDTADYWYGLERWKRGEKVWANHFPSLIPTADSVDFLFIPQNMQGRSSMQLKVYFKTSEEAKSAFETVHCPDSMIFKGVSEIKSNSDYHVPRVRFTPKDEISDNMVIKLLGSYIDTGKNLTGGIEYGLSLMAKDNSVIWWVRDSTL